MAHVLSLTDGTTTISLTTNGALLRQYTPGVSRNGQPVTESVDVMIYGSTTAEMQTRINVIDRMFVAAERRALSGTGPRVFLQFQPIGDATVWRAEVSSGALNLDDSALTVFSQAQIRAEIVLTRAPYWEGARTQIPLTNPNGTNNTAGLTINNGSTNYATIAAGVVAGSLPAPLEVRLRNTSGAGRSYRGFHVANNTFSPSVDNHIEGEENTASRPSSAVAGASGGNVATVTGNPINISFNIPRTVLTAYGGRWVHVLGRFTTITGIGGPVYSTVQLYDYYGFVRLYQTPTIPISDNQLMQSLGMIPLPPSGINGGTWEQMVLQLWFQSVSTLTVYVDYIAFAPAEERFYRYFVQRGMVVANNDWLVDDGIENMLYLIENSAYHPIYTTLTPPVHVMPAVEQRLYVWQEGSGARADWTMQIQAFYRPRRVSL